MTTETLLIVVLRIVLPLTILRWPLAGGILALLADALDIVFASLIDLGGLWNYHQLDKYLDTYYLALEAIVAQRWSPIPRWTATLLFGYRLTGVVLFEVTNIRLFLFLFPALFENFFLFYAAILRFAPDYELTLRRLTFWLAILLVPKMTQEYVLHYQRWLDDIVAIEVIEDVWKATFRWLRLSGEIRWRALVER